MSNLQNLSVPFNIPIPGGMHQGKMIIVQGNVPSKSQRFAVNLLTRSGDIALHVCPRFQENRVVRNNVLNMNWGPEESSGGMPIFPGQSFEILILCEPYSYKVAFNGRHFCEFSHRLPFNSVTNLAVDGEVSVHKVNFNDPSGYGNNNNEVSNSAPYGFQSDMSSNSKSGHLYPSVDSYPYPSVPNSRRSPSPSVPPYPGSGGNKYPSSGGSLYPNPSAPLYPTSGGPGYPSNGGSTYPQNPSLYPSQPSYPGVPHQGPYPQVPSPNPSGGTPSSHHQPGFFEQAGNALAGVLGPGVLAGGGTAKKTQPSTPAAPRDQADLDVDDIFADLKGFPGKKSGPSTPQPSSRDSRGQSHSILNDAGSALAGILGGAGLAAAANRSLRGATPQNSNRPQGSFLDAGSALAGILGGTGLSGGQGRSLHGGTPPNSTRPQGSFLGDAGSALAGILGGAALAGGAGRALRGATPQNPTRSQGSFLDDAGSALAGILGGTGLSGGQGRSIRGATPHSPTRPQGSFLEDAGSALAGIIGGAALAGGAGRSLRGATPQNPGRHQGSFLDDAGSALAGILGGGGLPGHHKHNKLGILGGALGTAVAGAALTGHLNPIKATKKQLKAQKKALKYGLPIAGVGLGAYALHKGLKKGFRRSSSSSSCSSSD